MKSGRSNCSPSESKLNWNHKVSLCYNLSVPLNKLRQEHLNEKLKKKTLQN